MTGIIIETILNQKSIILTRPSSVISDTETRLQMNLKTQAPTKAMYFLSKTTPISIREELIAMTNSKQLMYKEWLSRLNIQKLYQKRSSMKPFMMIMKSNPMPVTEIAGKSLRVNLMKASRSGLMMLQTYLNSPLSSQHHQVLNPNLKTNQFQRSKSSR